MNYAPICIFVYKRQDSFKRLVSSLLENPECSHTPVYIFSDAAKTSQDEISVEAVREFAHELSGFLEVTVVEREQNMGLANSIISGVSLIVAKYNKVIVLEDDLMVSSNFLAYMNQSLSVYANNKRVWSISGYSAGRISALPGNNDVFFGRRASSWGWGTWQDRWESVDWDVSDYERLEDANNRREFRVGGGDMPRMLARQQRGEIDSWAIRFCFSQYLNEAYDIVPRVSKVLNEGFATGATNTYGMDGRFATSLDTGDKRRFELPREIHEDARFNRAFRAPYCFQVRLKYRIISKLRKFGVSLGWM